MAQNWKESANRSFGNVINGVKETFLALGFALFDA